MKIEQTILFIVLITIIFISMCKDIEHYTLQTVAADIDESVWFLPTKEESDGTYHMTIDSNNKTVAVMTKLYAKIVFKFIKQENNKYHIKVKLQGEQDDSATYLGHAWEGYIGKTSEPFLWSIEKTENKFKFIAHLPPAIDFGIPLNLEDERATELGTPRLYDSSDMPTTFTLIPQTSTSTTNVVTNMLRKITKPDFSYSDLLPSTNDSSYTTSDVKKCQPEHGECDNIDAITGFYPEWKHHNVHDYSYVGVDLKSKYLPGDVKYNYKDRHLKSSPNKVYRDVCEKNEVISGIKRIHGDDVQYQCIKPEISINNERIAYLERDDASKQNYLGAGDMLYNICPHKNQLFGGFGKPHIRDHSSCVSYNEKGMLVDVYKKAEAMKKEFDDNDCKSNLDDEKCKESVKYIQNTCNGVKTDENDIIDNDIKKHWLRTPELLGWNTDGTCGLATFSNECEKYGFDENCTPEELETLKQQCLRFNIDNEDISSCRKELMQRKLDQCTEYDIPEAVCSRDELENAKDEKGLEGVQKSVDIMLAASQAGDDKQEELLQLARNMMDGNQNQENATNEENNSNTTEDAQEENSNTSDTHKYILIGAGFIMFILFILIIKKIKSQPYDDDYYYDEQSGGGYKYKNLYKIIGMTLIISIFLGFMIKNREMFTPLENDVSIPHFINNKYREYIKQRTQNMNYVKTKDLPEMMNILYNGPNMLEFINDIRENEYINILLEDYKKIYNDQRDITKVRYHFAMELLLLLQNDEALRSQQINFFSI